jgi:hypothetical protein
VYRLALAALLVAGSACAEPTVAPTEDQSWHLLVRTEGGTISLLKNLTRHECEFSRDRALGNPATDEEKAAYKAEVDRVQNAWGKWMQDHGCDPSRGYGGTSAESYKMKDGTCMRGSEFAYPGEGMFTVTPGDIKSAECFQ